LYQRCSLADKGTASGLGDDRVGLSTFATSSVVADVTHIFIDRKRLSSDGGLISRNDGVASMLALVVIVRVCMILGVVLFGVFDHFVIFVGHLWCIEITDQTRFPSDNLTFLDNELERVSPDTKRNGNASENASICLQYHPGPVL
jgi:hypothetical protein